MKFFVYHKYDVDGGYGDAIFQKDLLGILEADSLEEAKEWAEKHSHDHIYDSPYMELHEGNIVIDEFNPKEFTVDDCPWDEDTLKRITGDDCLEVNRVKRVIEFFEKHPSVPTHQIFDSRNTAGDRMYNVYSADGVRVDACYDWGYSEVFGLTDKEFERLCHAVEGKRDY